MPIEIKFSDERKMQFLQYAIHLNIFKSPTFLNLPLDQQIQVAGALIHPILVEFEAEELEMIEVFALNYQEFIDDITDEDLFHFSMFTLAGFITGFREELWKKKSPEQIKTELTTMMSRVSKMDPKASGHFVKALREILPEQTNAFLTKAGLAETFDAEVSVNNAYLNTPIETLLQNRLQTEAALTQVVENLVNDITAKATPENLRIFIDEIRENLPGEKLANMLITGSNTLRSVFKNAAEGKGIVIGDKINAFLFTTYFKNALKTIETAFIKANLLPTNDVAADLKRAITPPQP